MKQILALTLLCTGLLSCKSTPTANDPAIAYRQNATGNLVTRTLTVGDIDGLFITHGIAVEYTQTDTDSPSIEITAPERNIDYVVTQVSDGTLSLYYEEPGKNNVSWDGPITARISGPALKLIKTSSSSKLTLANGMKSGNDVMVMISSNSELEWRGEFKGQETLSINSSSGAKLKGETLSAPNLILKSSSSSTSDLRSVQAGSLILHASSQASFKAGSIRCSDLSLDNSSGAKSTTERIECQNLIGTVSSQGRWSAPTVSCTDCHLEASSTGVAELVNLQTGGLIAEASSQGKLTLNGRCKQAMLKALSTGEIKAQGLKAGSASTKVSSRATIHAPQTPKIDRDEQSGGRVI